VSSLFTKVPLDETIHHIIHEFTPTTSYHNSAQSYSSEAFSAMSPRTQLVVLMTSYINKLMDAAWATHMGNPDHFFDAVFNYTTKFNCSVFKKPGKTTNTLEI